MLGYLPDRFDARDLPMGTGVLPREPGDLRPLIREVFDQGQTNTCVANAVVSAKAMRDVARGLSWKPASRIWVYRLGALALGDAGRDSDGRLLDLGIRPRDALCALAKLGVPPEHEWPFEIERLQEQPPWNLRRRAVEARLSYFRCATLADIRVALSYRYPVVVGFHVDRTFLEERGPEHIEDFDQSALVGGHMVTLVTDEPDRDRLWLLNSYGSGWRKRGLVSISASAVARRKVDAWAVL